MKQICVIVKVEDLDATRANAQTIPPFKNQQTLNIQLSPTGELPATHHFCTMNYTDKLHKLLLAAQKLSIIETGDPKEILENHGLKIIKK